MKRQGLGLSPNPKHAKYRRNEYMKLRTYVKKGGGRVKRMYIFELRLLKGFGGLKDWKIFGRIE